MHPSYIWIIHVCMYVCVCVCVCVCVRACGRTDGGRTDGCISHSPVFVSLLCSLDLDMSPTPDSIPCASDLLTLLIRSQFMS